MTTTPTPDTEPHTNGGGGEVDLLRTVAVLLMQATGLPHDHCTAEAAALVVDMRARYPHQQPSRVTTDPVWLREVTRRGAELNRRVARDLTGGLREQLLTAAEDLRGGDRDAAERLVSNTLARAEQAAETAKLIHDPAIPVPAEQQTLRVLQTWLEFEAWRVDAEPALRRQAWSLCRSQPSPRHDVEDLVAETILTIYRRRDTIDSPTTYARRVLTNKYIDLYELRTKKGHGTSTSYGSDEDAETNSLALGTTPATGMDAHLDEDVSARVLSTILRAMLHARWTDRAFWSTRTRVERWLAANFQGREPVYPPLRGKDLAGKVGASPQAAASDVSEVSDRLRFAYFLLQQAPGITYQHVVRGETVAACLNAARVELPAHDRDALEGALTRRRGKQVSQPLETTEVPFPVDGLGPRLICPHPLTDTDQFHRALAHYRHRAAAAL